MNSQQLVTATYNNIRKRLILILVFSIICAIALAILAFKSGIKYTSNAVIFPLTNSESTSSSSSVLSALTGRFDMGKNFTEENSVNIIDLAQSRTISEEVARTVVPAMDKKTIGRILFEEFNKNKFFFQKSPQINTDDSSLAIWAASEQLRPNLSAIITKNNSFLINYTGKSPELVKVISYTYIDKISSYYIAIKREKSRQDFEFATRKADSLRSVLNAKDKNLIGMDNKTLFTNTDRLQFKVPVENVILDKQMIRSQYADAVANQQNAAYKLQRATPVIKVLDKPDPPYDTSSRSPILFGIGGFIGGFAFLSFLLSLPVLFKFSREEFRKLIYGTEPS
ncbi:MAG: hypothetical protein H3C36_01660 [Chitinophagaceae bacterium]|nr:hypothetical protein [Chitinophagaceae bacterium]MCO5287540.1 hypothetical protein [Chitinophagaceae bacterium]MCZ2397614.1 hypothetical protein [Chitinophagales bacterium]